MLSAMDVYSMVDEMVGVNDGAVVIEFAVVAGKRDGGR